MLHQATFSRAASVVAGKGNLSPVLSTPNKCPVECVTENYTMLPDFGTSETISSASFTPRWSQGEEGISMVFNNLNTAEIPT